MVASKFTLPETNSKFAPENRPKPNRRQSYSNHPFLGAKMLVSGRVRSEGWGVNSYKVIQGHYFLTTKEKFVVEDEK